MEKSKTGRIGICKFCGQQMIIGELPPLPDGVTYETFDEDVLDEEESELLTLPLSKVEPRQAQPRERFDEAALQDLADSIAQYGLIQPITVRKLDSGYYQIIAGERRWRAARLAGLEEIPVRVLV